MRLRLVVGLALVSLMISLAASRPVQAQAKAGKPLVVVRLNALDELIADARYVAELTGQAEAFKQFEKMLQARTGPKGLEGLDTKKPIGLYGILPTKIDESQVVLLVPVADEKALLAQLEKLDLKAEKDKDGLYTVNAENVPYPIIFRLANGYLYGTAKVSDKQAAALDKDRLPKPEDILSIGAGSALALTANLDTIPEPYKKIAVTQVALELSKAVDKGQPGESEAEKKLRVAFLEEAGEQVKALINESGALTLRLDLDRNKHDLSMSLSLEPLAGSGLAKSVASLTPAASVGASLVGAESAMHGSLYLAVPERVRKVIAGVYDEEFKKAVEKEGDKRKKEAAEVLVKALKPSALAGVSDLGFDLRGPGKSGKYTIVGGARLKEGGQVEKAIKDIFDKLPAADKKGLTVDADKANGVSIHKAQPENLDNNAKELFGEGPIYFAFREDAVLITGGEGALEAIKEALGTKPKTGSPLEFEVSLARLARIIAKDQKNAPEIARKVFKEKDSDKVSFSIQAGKRLELKVSAKTPVLTFGSELDKARKGGKTSRDPLLK